MTAQAQCDEQVDSVAQRLGVKPRLRQGGDMRGLRWPKAAGGAAFPPASPVRLCRGRTTVPGGVRSGETQSCPHAPRPACLSVIGSQIFPASTFPI